MMTKGMYSSKTAEWETPQDVFDHYNQLFNFQLDVCASEENNKCVNFYSKDDDGLKQHWYGRNWMNPPYGRQISKWVEKAWWESLDNNALTVCLLPARTDTAWWQNFVLNADSVLFVRGRLKFGGQKPAPFPSAIVIFGLNYHKEDKQ